MTTTRFSLLASFWLLAFSVVIGQALHANDDEQILLNGKETLEEMTQILTNPHLGHAEFMSLARRWSGSRDRGQLDAIIASLTPVKQIALPRFRTNAQGELFFANDAKDQEKGDLLATLIPIEADPVKRGFLIGLSDGPYLTASPKLREVLYKELDNFEIVGHSTSGVCEAGIRAYNTLLSWLEDIRVVDPDQTHGMSPHCLPEYRDPQIAELKRLINEKALLKMEVKSPAMKAPESMSTPTPSEQPTSSTPWSIIVVLIVAAIGLLWLQLKRRS